MCYDFYKITSGRYIMADREENLKELDGEIKNIKDKIKIIESSLKKAKSQAKEKLLSEKQELQKKLKLAEDIYQKLESAPPGSYGDLKAVSSALFDYLKGNVQEYTHLLSMDPVYHAKDDVIEFSCEKAAQVEKCIKEKPLLSAACALGIGFILGALLTRSK